MEQELKSWWTRKILSFQWWGSTSSSKAPTPFPLGVHLFYTVLAPTPFYRQILAPHLNDLKPSPEPVTIEVIELVPS